MKFPAFSKGEKQKLVLSGIFLVALLYCYFTFILGPLTAGKTKLTAEVADLSAKIAQSKKTLADASRLEGKAQTAINRLAELETFLPAGAPLAWFPPMVKSSFAVDGMDAPLVRLLNQFPMKQPELEHFAKDDWSVDLPRVDFLVLGGNLARFQEDQPLVSVTSLRVHALLDDPATQSATLGLNAIVRK